MEYVAKPNEVYLPKYDPETLKILLTIAYNGLEGTLNKIEESQKISQKFMRETVFS
ncbi:hypothetical protein HYT23_04465 [Candidatus Pacearchaeota archaeon]|nr:hypothetical protein [Candidatus Pacearchaeota archaeon]